MRRPPHTTAQGPGATRSARRSGATNVSVIASSIHLVTCCALEIPPDPQDADEHRRVIAQLNEEVGQTVMPTEADVRRHPSMHRTNTLDCITCVIGEIHLVTDVEEVLMTPGDSVVIRGTNHAWKNRSDTPCLLVGVMVDAVPKGEDAAPSREPERAGRGAR
jgi:quercetin dioxygenase-like cupin family protein